MHPAHHGLVDHVGGDDVVLGVGELGADEREEGVVIDEDDVVVNLDVEGVVVKVVVGTGIAVLVGVVDIALGITGLALEQLIEQIDVVLVVGTAQPDDLVNQSTVANKVSLEHKTVS